MARKLNTKCNGKDFSKDEERAVWEKAEIIYTLSPNPSAIPYIVGGVPPSPEVKNFDKDSPEYNIRKDKCGATIHFNQYGKRSSEFGWEIDHIIPVAKCGSDELENLQPLHWKNNASKSDDPDKPSRYCKVTS